MAPLLVTKIAVLALSSSWTALGVNTATMRREQPRMGEADSAALFTASGTFISVNDPGQNDWCDDDFPLGEEKSNCKETPTEKKISRSECLEAMVEARAAYKNNNTALFDIGSLYFHDYPRGCFSKTEASGCEPYGKCYYYNECAGDQCGEGVGGGGGGGTGTADSHNGGAITEGTPVCKRVKVEHGTSGTSAGCPNGYDNIKDETTCAVLAACLAACTGGTNAVSGGTQFRINIINASKYHDHPKWCFVDPTDGCAYYNKPLVAAAGQTMPDPQNAANGGTPLCNVTTVTDYSGASVGSVDHPPMSQETLQAAHDAGVINITQR